MRFSVIVPIYKIEKYIGRCIDSVLAQSFTDYELILVDDGSPDGCGAICDEYAKKDPRIKVIHKENGGLVSARQAGIRIATGDYIFNLDGDDAICPDALESAEQILQKNQADIVSFCYRTCTDGAVSDVVEDLVEEGLYDKEQIREKIFPKLLCDETMRHVFYFSWGRAIRRELAVKHQLQIDPVISLGEDLSCMIPCYMEANSAYISKKDIYLYTIRNDSLTMDFKTGQIKQLENVISKLKKLEGNKPADFDEQIARYACFMCFALLATAAEGNHFRVLKELKELLRSFLHKEEIRKARFGKITPKSRIAVFMIKRQWIGLTFYFLNFCKKVKDLRRGDKA